MRSSWDVKLLRMAIRKSPCEVPEGGCARGHSGWKCNPAWEEGLKAGVWSSEQARRPAFSPYHLDNCFLCKWCGFFLFLASSEWPDRCERTVLELLGHLRMISRKVQLCVCPCGLYVLIWSKSVWQSVKKGLCAVSFHQPAFFFFLLSVCLF